MDADGISSHVIAVDVVRRRAVKAAMMKRTMTLLAGLTLLGSAALALQDASSGDYPAGGDVALAGDYYDRLALRLIQDDCGWYWGGDWGGDHLVARGPLPSHSTTSTTFHHAMVLITHMASITCMASITSHGSITRMASTMAGR